jgi:hypothetical protein
MTHRSSGENARRLVGVAALCTASLGMAGAARAGIWATEPVVGLQGEYSTNPNLLLDVGHTSETHGAILLDAPTTYHANDASLSIMPSVRIANSAGYSSLASDYAHLNIVGQIDAERDTLTATAQLDRDSSLYHDYLVDGATGVRRDTAVEDVAWSHAFTERLAFNLEANSSRVVYGQSSISNTLTDYRYTSAQHERAHLVVRARRCRPVPVGGRRHAQCQREPPARLLAAAQRALESFRECRLLPRNQPGKRGRALLSGHRRHTL